MLYEKESQRKLKVSETEIRGTIVSMIHWMDGRERQFRDLAGRRIQCSEPITVKEMFHQAFSKFNILYHHLK
jgi:hypothetical protein